MSDIAADHHINIKDVHPYVAFRRDAFISWTGRGCLRILFTTFTVREHVTAPTIKYATPAERV
jgi:hypothetical protein